MDWERLLINFGVVVGFFAVMAFWIGLAMWMRVDADKRGLVGWVWAFVGLLTGPIGLVAYIVWRGNRPVLPVVRQRDALIARNSRAQLPLDYNPADRPEGWPDNLPDGPVIEPARPLNQPNDNSVSAALEAEQRRYRPEA